MNHTPANEQEFIEEDVINEKIDHLIEDRIPWLLAGLLGGLVATIIVSKYQAILSLDVRLAFFIPIIVYLSDAVGTQTDTIYVRELAERKRQINLAKYIFKETLVGTGAGTIAGTLLGLFSAYWLDSLAIGLTIGLTMLINLILAPGMALIISNLIHKTHTDPAIGSGPVATIIQDMISLLVYFAIASIIIF